MEVDCEGCAGCCVDWHALAADVVAPDRAGPRQPLDGATNFVPLERDEVRGFVDDGLADALTPRLWTVPEGAGAGAADETASNDADATDASETDPDATRERPDGTDGGRAAPAVPTAGTVAIDGYDLAAAGGRPVFYVGLRKPPKPVAPFDRDDAAWLPTCAFLDPETLQCRIHGDDRYPGACAAYPGFNLLLGQDTECERVEAARGGDRLVDDEPPTDPPDGGVGPEALGSKLFAFPEPDALAGCVERLARGAATDDDRAAFVAVAAASSPGTLSIAEERRAEARERALAADSWVGRAIDAWEERSGEGAAPELAESIEVSRGAPPTPGWE